MLFSSGLGKIKHKRIHGATVMINGRGLGNLSSNVVNNGVYISNRANMVDWAL